jgi:putative adenylate-forming enzyme
VSLPVGTLLRHYLAARLRFRGLRGDALIRHQDRLGRAAVEFARARAPYYRDLFAGRPASDWRRFPTTDKAAMMAHFDTYNTAGVTREEAQAVALRAEADRDFSPTLRGLTVGLSSGTSGHRGLFLVSDAERAAWAGVVLARVLPALPPSGYRVAFFLRSDSNLYGGLRGRRIDFRYFDLMTPLPEAVAALNDLQPDILAGPPRLLGYLAAARRRGDLRIRPVKVVSFAEVLEPEDRERIAGAFDRPVHQAYQCTEGLLALTCPEVSLHVQEDVVAFQTEALPGDAERVTPIVTDLYRRVQPMIRHRMNDVLVMASKPCACGSAFRVIERIEGRCDDVCEFPDAEGRLRPFFPDTIRRMVLLTPGIADYQAVQEAPGRLRVHVEPAGDAPFDGVTAALRENVERTLAHYGCRAVGVEVERGLPSLDPRAKRRRVIRREAA